MAFMFEWKACYLLGFAPKKDPDGELSRGFHRSLMMTRLAKVAMS
jgi:hypothetical protein